MTKWDPFAYWNKGFWYVTFGSQFVQKDMANKEHFLTLTNNSDSICVFICCIFYSYLVFVCYLCNWGTYVSVDHNLILLFTTSCSGHLAVFCTVLYANAAPVFTLNFPQWAQGDIFIETSGSPIYKAVFQQADDSLRNLTFVRLTCSVVQK